MNPKRIAMAVLSAAAMCGAAQAAEITIYKQPQFSGGGVTVTNAARDLAPLGINDQASSLVVRGGSWEVCTQPDFNGDCRTLAPGEYATLDASLNHRIESARQVQRQARGRGRDRDQYARESDRNARDRDAFRDDGRAYEPPDNGGWAHGDRDRPQGGDAWRP